MILDRCSIATSSSAVSVGVAVGSGVSVAVGSGVSVAVGSGVSVAVGSGASVDTGVGVDIANGVGVLLGWAVPSGVGSSSHADSKAATTKHRRPIHDSLWMVRRKLIISWEVDIDPMPPCSHALSGNPLTLQPNAAEKSLPFKLSINVLHGPCIRVRQAPGEKRMNQLVVRVYRLGDIRLPPVRFISNDCHCSTARRARRSPSHSIATQAASVGTPLSRRPALPTAAART